MKFESDERNFSLNINSFGESERKNEFESAGKLIKENKSLFLSIIAIAVALANLAFGLFINFSSRILTNVWESAENYHFIVVMLVIAVVMTVASVTLGILALVYYRKSEKSSLDKAAVFTAILSFVLSGAALSFNFLGLFVW